MKIPHSENILTFVCPHFVTCYLYSKNQSGEAYPRTLTSDETFLVPDKFLIVLDMEEGTLSFVVEGQFLGVAHRGLRGKKVSYYSTQALTVSDSA